MTYPPTAQMALERRFTAISCQVLIGLKIRILIVL
jgi:hypothetical protein